MGSNIIIQIRMSLYKPQDISLYQNFQAFQNPSVRSKSVSASQFDIEHRPCHHPRERPLLLHLEPKGRPLCKSLKPRD